MTQTPYEWLRTTPTRLNTWAAIATTQGIADVKGYPQRDILPEPFDIGNHQGNINDSLLIGSVAGLVTIKALERIAPKSSNKNRRRAMLTIAVTAGLAINSLVETKFGQRIIGENTMHSLFGDHVTTDPLDLVYGTITSAAASYTISPQVSPKQNLHNPAEVSYEVTPSDTNMTKTTIP